MRVLQVTTSDQRRGAEVFAHDLARGLTRLGHDVTTAALERSDDPARLDAVVLGGGRTHPDTWTALIGGLRANDVAIAHGGPSLVPVAVAAALTGTPFLYRNIGDPAFWGDVRLADLRVGIALRRAAGVIALYEGAREHLVARYRLQPDRVSVASNAVDLRAFPRRDASTRARARAALDVTETAPVLAYLGALSPEKRPHLALDVAHGIDDAVLLVAGTGPLRPDLDARASATAATRVQMLGSFDRPADLLAAADVLLIPSRTEGVPGSLLEALAIGTPVVATDVGGVGEVLGALGGGIAVAAAPDELDLVDALRTAVRTVLRRPDAFVAPTDALSATHGLDAIAQRYDRALWLATTSTPVT